MKQQDKIEELKETIARIINDTMYFILDEDDSRYLAEALYDAGYRKQSENTVEVVRCKDCKFCKTIDIKNVFPTRFLFCHRREHYSESVNDSDFCSYGEERK